MRIGLQGEVSKPSSLYIYRYAARKYVVFVQLFANPFSRALEFSVEGPAPQLNKLPSPAGISPEIWIYLALFS